MISSHCLRDLLHTDSTSLLRPWQSQQLETLLLRTDSLGGSRTQANFIHGVTMMAFDAARAMLTCLPIALPPVGIEGPNSQGSSLLNLRRLRYAQNHLKNFILLHLGSIQVVIIVISPLCSNFVNP